MNRDKRGGVILIFLIFFITASAVVLGILQYRWTSDVSETEENRLRRSLFTSSAQVMNASKEEIIIPLELLRIDYAVYVEQDWTALQEAYSFWKSNAGFPNLISAVYLIEKTDETLRYFRYREDTGSFQSISMPEVFSGIEEVSSLPRAEEESRDLRRIITSRGIILEPVRLEGKNENLPDTGAKNLSVFLAIHVNLDTLFGEILPYYMNEYLQGYPYRIAYTDPSNGEERTVEQPEGAIEDSWVPDASIPLSSLFRNIDPFMPPDDRLASPNKASVRVWLSRSEKDVPPDSEAPMVKEMGMLHIFYPGGPIHTLIKTRRAVNLGISIGLLLLLSACMMILGRLYRNTVNLRAVEQEFVSSMSHELRTPIAVLQSTAENLRSGLVSDPAKISRYGEVMYKEIKRLSRMVESILLYSGLEQRKQRNNRFETIDLKGLVEEVTEALKEPARKAKATMIIRQNPATNEIRSDSEAIRIILENLLMNAVYHGVPSNCTAEKPGAIRLFIEPKILSRGIALTVEDEGPGIPQSESKRVFEPFVRGEASIREQHPGSGLGLHLVKRIVELLGGTVRLESPYTNTIGRIQQGCRFTVELPSVRVM